MQRLMRIADKMDEPNKVVGADPIGEAGRRRQATCQGLDLSDRVDRIGRLKRRSVGRKGDVLEVPIFVHQGVVVADIAAGVRTARLVAVVAIAKLRPFNIVCPGRGADEGVLGGFFRGAA